MSFSNVLNCSSRSPNWFAALVGSAICGALGNSPNQEAGKAMKMPASKSAQTHLKIHAKFDAGVVALEIVDIQAVGLVAFLVTPDLHLVGSGNKQSPGKPIEKGRPD